MLGFRPRDGGGTKTKTANAKAERSFTRALALRNGSCVALDRFCAMNSLPKSASAAKALWALQRRVTFDGVRAPSRAKGTRWWNSRQWVSGQRRPAAST